MSDLKPNKTFIIRHTVTKELFRAQSGKTSWRATGHAKNAFNLSVAYGRSCERYGLQVIREQKSWGIDECGPKFDQQNVWEIVELKSESEDVLKEALCLLSNSLDTFCKYRIDEEIVSDINSFLEEHLK